MDQTASTPLRDETQGVQLLERLESNLRQRWTLLQILMVVDVILTPLSLIASFGFNFEALFGSQASRFSLDSSCLDWILVCWLRDSSMLVYGYKSFRSMASREEASTASREEGTGHLVVARRIAVGVFLYGVGRLSLLQWKNESEFRDASTFVYSCLMAPILICAAHSLLRSRERFEKQKEEISRVDDAGENAEENPDPPQFSSSLNFWQTLRVMKPYFWPSTGVPKEVAWNRVRALSTWACVLGSKTANLISPIFLAQATNEVSDELKTGETSMPPGAIWNLIIYAFLIFVSKALKEAQSLVYIKVQQAAYIEIAENTFVHLHNLSLDWHLRKKMGNVIRSMDRGIAAAQQVMQYVFLYLFPALAEAFAMGMIFVLHFNNPRLAIFVLLNVFLYCYVTVQITLWRKQFRTATTKHDNELHDRITDSLVNYETVKYFTAEEYERQQYRSIVEKFQKMSMATQASLSLLNVVQQLIINFALAGGMIMATYRLLQEDGSLGEFVAVNAYIIQTFAPLSFLGTIYNMIVNAIVDMKSFGQLLAETSDVRDEPNAKLLDVNRIQPFMIEFKNVSFNYRRQPHGRSIKNVSFTTERGGTTALVGTTGAGKTTITRLLFRFYDPVEGQVLVNGQDAKSVTQKSLRQAIGFVPQDVVMFNDTIAHNIKYGNIEKCDEEKLEDAAEKAQLKQFIEQQDKGYKTVVGERGLKLSGGEKQRLAIARCLVKNPSIVVLDEATSALDSQTEQKIQQALNVLNTQRTVLAIAHRLSTVRDFNAILVLENGEIIERGTHGDLLEKKGRYAEMWHQQARGQAREVEGDMTGETTEQAKEADGGMPGGHGQSHAHGQGHGYGHGHG